MTPDNSRQDSAGRESTGPAPAGHPAAGSESIGRESTDRESARRGEASGQHQALRRDVDDKRAKQRLGDVGLDDRGDAFEDEQRDRHSRGARPDGGSE